ncbi:MAG: queuosine precursor transporter [Myxococcota bacterium]
MSEGLPLPSEQYTYEDLPSLRPQTLQQRREGIFLLCSGIFLGSLSVLNVLSVTRFLNMSFDILGYHIPFIVPVGVLPYPITFLCTDFISELYGKKRASQVVWMGFILNVWVLFILWLGGVLPGESPGSYDPNSIEGSRVNAFFTIRTLTFGAVVASMISYLFAQLVDVHIFHFWKRKTQGKHLWLRNNASTLVSQFVDTFSVILITHYYAQALYIDPSQSTFSQLWTYIYSGYVFKASCALVDTLPFYIGTQKLTRYLRLPPVHETPS